MEENSRVLVLGVGNLLMQDEGVGVHVVQALERRKLPEGVRLLDGGSGGFTLLGDLEAAGQIILIDAAADGHAIGTVTRSEPRYSKDYPPTLMAHDIGLKDLLDIFYMRGAGSKVTLFAVTIDPLQKMGMELSPRIAQAAEEAAGCVMAELKHCLQTA